MGRHPRPEHGFREKGIPTEWDVKSKKNVKWVSALGSQAYGNPVVAGGVIWWDE